MGEAVELSGRRGTCLSLRNPVMTASGCLGDTPAALEACLEGVGAFVTPSITPERRRGSALPRIVEAAAGVIYDTGLPNRGAERAWESLRRMPSTRTSIVASLAGATGREIVSLALQLASDETVAPAALELNLCWPSDPRPDAGRTPGEIAELVETLTEHVPLPLIVKLSPREDVAAAALAAADGGADAVCIGHGWPAATGVGGSMFVGRVPRLSGTAVRALTLRLVEETARLLAIDVIACGGIDSVEAACSYLDAGARAVQVGSALFRDPTLAASIAAALDVLATGNAVLDPRGGGWIA